MRDRLDDLKKVFLPWNSCTGVTRSKMNTDQCINIIISQLRAVNIDEKTQVKIRFQLKLFMLMMIIVTDVYYCKSPSLASASA